jgi:ABC-2 type transport system permease protein
VDPGVRAAGRRHPRHHGLIAGIWAEKFDQLAAFQNFLIVPLTFLAGVFYSIHSLPPFWQAVSHLNPFFYMIDGFRYGFFGPTSAAQPGHSWRGLVVLAALALRLLRAATSRGTEPRITISRTHHATTPELIHGYIARNALHT